jgi:MFS family permease
MKFDDPSLMPLPAQSVRSLAAEQNSTAIFYGWRVVLVSALGLFWGIPIAVYSFSVFFKPLMQEFHAGRAAVSLGFTVQLLVGALSAAPAGWLIDRFGPRRVIMTGTAIFGLILIANRLFSGSLTRLYFFYVLLGLSIHGVGPIPYGTVVSHWFDRIRGLALGLTMLGIGLGAVVMPTVAQTLIARFGWNTAYSILGASVLLICWPTVACFLKEKPEDLGLVCDGATVTTYLPHNKGVRHGFTAREAWRSRDFWIMVCAFILVSASVQGCVVHMAAMLSDKGLSPHSAVLGSSLIGAAVLIGRTGTGYLLDRFLASRLAAIFFGGSAMGVAVLWLANSQLMLGGAFLVGLGLGAEVDIIAYITSRYFGLLDFGKVYSSALAAFALAGALGPLVMGAGFDRTGSYRDPLILFFVAAAIAAALMTRLGPYRFGAPQTVPNQPILQVSVAE